MNLIIVAIASRMYRTLSVLLALSALLLLQAVTERNCSEIQGLEHSSLSPNLTVAENQDSFNVTCTFNWQIGDHAIFICINQTRETIDQSTMCNFSSNSCVKTVEETSPFNVSCCGYDGENVPPYCSDIISVTRLSRSTTVDGPVSTKPLTTITEDPPTTTSTELETTTGFTSTSSASVHRWQNHCVLSLLCVVSLFNNILLSKQTNRQ